MIKICAGGILGLLIIFSFGPYYTDARVTRTIREAQPVTDTFNIRSEVRGNSETAQFRNTEIIVKRKGDDHFIRIPKISGESIDALLARFRNDDSVEYAEPNYIAYAFVVPNDTYYYPYQWNFDNSVSGGVDAEEAWDITNGSGVIVAVIDTGVAYEDYGRYYKAPDLENTEFVPGYDFVNNDSHPNDDEAHGTHVTGTIAQSTNNGQGTAGLAYGAFIMPIKVLDSRGSGSYADVAEGIRFAADNGAKVINLSLGGSVGTSYLEEAVAYAYNKGVTIVAASGNGSSGSVSYPAAYDNYVIAVGATRYDETRASYSNYGSALDIMAPGGDINVDQNGDGYGDGILQQTFGRRTNSWGYYFYQGTSMATPHVAAAAAMVIASGIATSPDDVRNVLQNSAKDLGSPGRDNTYGYGLLNIAAALGSAGPVSEPDPDPEPEPDPDPEPQNDPPVITSDPITTATEGELYSYFVTATDTDPGDTIVYSLTQNPGGMTITSGAAGVIEWTPTSVQVGVQSVTVEVTDGEFTDSQSYEITVEAVPTEPPPPEPPPDPAGPLFSDSFENGLGNWTQYSQKNWVIKSRRPTDGKYSLEFDGKAVDETITSVPIDLQGNQNVSISFSMYIERSFDNGEYIAFDVSTDGGNSWTEYARLRGNVDPEKQYHYTQFDLSGISQLLLRFRGTASSGAEDANMDNVIVTAF